MQGQVVYANYGRKEDLEELQKKKVELKNKVVLLRAGRLSFAEQVCVCVTNPAQWLRNRNIYTHQWLYPVSV